MAERVVQLGDCRSQGCRDWVRAGRPWTLAPSPAALQADLRAEGLTVYAAPDFDHLVASTPEDHTSFSATGYPGVAPRWIGNAIDIMPRNDSPAAREEAEQLARQIIADKDAGVPGTEWIKYLNWTEASGECWHTSWQPNKKTVSSTDRGHIHVSGLTTWATRAATPYRPLARLHGTAPKEEDDMYLAIISNAVVVSNSLQCRWVTGPEDGFLRARHGQPVTVKPSEVASVGPLVGAVPPGWPGAVVAAQAAVDPAKLAAALAPLLQADVTVDMVAAALESERGQAALAAAAEYASDH